LIGALVVTHAMLRRLTSWRCIIIIINVGHIDREHHYEAVQAVLISSVVDNPE